ncbi:MAG: AI-2E family transporter [Anaerolineaceae bacterium]|nr:AI-2E family transporter [Anaerolineaceae bacterium]
MIVQTPPQHYQWTFRRVVLATLVLALIIFGFWLLYRFYIVIFILFIAIVLGTVIRPIVSWLNRRGIPRILGMVLVLFLLLALLIGFLTLLYPLIFNQGSTILAVVLGYYQNLRTWAANSSSQLILGLGEYLPPTLKFSGIDPSLQTGPQVLASAEQTLVYISIGIQVLFVGIALVLLTFHWTLDGPQNIQSLLQLLPKAKRGSIGELVSAMESKVGYFILGQSILCLLIGVMAMVVYLILGLPNALVLALVAAVMEAVPMIGPFLGAIPAAIVALSISPVKLIWVVVGTIIIQQLENNFLVPRVMRKAVGVNPFVSLLAIFAFSSLFGIAGALMAIPIAAIIQLLLDRFVFRQVEIEPDDLPGRDVTSRLRYETQDLAQGLRKQARVTINGSDINIKQLDQVMDEIESITTDLDKLLAQSQASGEE